MAHENQDVLESIVQKANTELILLAVIMVLIIAALTGLYAMFLKGERARRKEDMEKEDARNKAEAERKKATTEITLELMKVVKNNTEVQTRIVTIIDAGNNENRQSFNRVHDRLDELLKNTVLVKAICKDVKDVLTTNRGGTET
jgi:flagellar basal body-associated protein FliL